LYDYKLSAVCALLAELDLNTLIGVDISKKNDFQNFKNEFYL